MKYSLWRGSRWLLLVGGLLLAGSLHPAALTAQLAPPSIGQIAFDSYRTGNTDIYVVNLDGSGLINLTQHPAYDTHAAWSPDGQTLAFQSDRALAGTFSIYLMDADGSNVRLFATNAAQPAWSPDGTELAFLAPANSGGSTIVRMKRDGTGRQTLTNGDAAFTPAWSPDGTRIAYTIWNGQPRGVYTIRTDGTDRRLLVASTATEHPFTPRWSPDGQTVAFNGDNGTQTYVTLVDAQGQQRRPLLPQRVEDTGFASWAPNGQLLVVVCNIRMNVSDLCLMDRSGFLLTTVTTGTWNHLPAWNPASGSGVPAGIHWRTAFLPQAMRRGR